MNKKIYWKVFFSSFWIDISEGLLLYQGSKNQWRNHVIILWTLKEAMKIFQNVVKKEISNKSSFIGNALFIYSLGLSSIQSSVLYLSVRLLEKYLIICDSVCPRRPPVIKFVTACIYFLIFFFTLKINKNFL